MKFKAIKNAAVCGFLLAQQSAAWCQGVILLVVVLFKYVLSRSSYLLSWLVTWYSPVTHGALFFVLVSSCP